MQLREDLHGFGDVSIADSKIDPAISHIFRRLSASRIRALGCLPVATALRMPGAAGKRVLLPDCVETSRSSIFSRELIALPLARSRRMNFPRLLPILPENVFRFGTLRFEPILANFIVNAPRSDPE
jgi:hypothetical protein